MPQVPIPSMASRSFFERVGEKFFYNLLSLL